MLIKMVSTDGKNKMFNQSAWLHSKSLVGPKAHFVHVIN